jgi:hypothetical protein
MVCVRSYPVIEEQANVRANGNMLANRPAILTGSPTSRAAITNDPLRVRADGRTPQGRRLRDLFRSFQVAAGNPSDPASVASILAAAELTVAAEEARAALLAGSGDIEQVVRLENLAARAVRRLGVKPGVAPKAPTLAEHLARRAAERADAQSAYGVVADERTHHGPRHGDGEASEERCATFAAGLPPDGLA